MVHQDISARVYLDESTGQVRITSRDDFLPRELNVAVPHDKSPAAIVREAFGYKPQGVFAVAKRSLEPEPYTIDITHFGSLVVDGSPGILANILSQIDEAQIITSISEAERLVKRRGTQMSGRRDVRYFLVDMTQYLSQDNQPSNDVLTRILRGARSNGVYVIGFDTDPNALPSSQALAHIGFRLSPGHDNSLYVNGEAVGRAINFYPAEWPKIDREDLEPKGYQNGLYEIGYNKNMASSVVFDARAGKGLLTNSPSVIDTVLSGVPFGSIFLSIESAHAALDEKAAEGDRYVVVNMDTLLDEIVVHQTQKSNRHHTLTHELLTKGPSRNIYVVAFFRDEMTVASLSDELVSMFSLAVNRRDLSPRASSVVVQYGLTGEDDFIPNPLAADIDFPAV